MKSKIVTPHAAVLVWNYTDRIGTEGMSNNQQSSGVKLQHEVEEKIISTLSCVSIQTNKTKSQPNGTFQLTLAPFRNWVSTITPGSWCAILMSNEPITEKDLKKANPKLLKMIGRVETVRCETKVGDDGTRNTLYYVSGVDWGYIFNSNVYMSPNITSQGTNDQASVFAAALNKLMFGKNGELIYNTQQTWINSIMQIFGKTLGPGIDAAGKSTNVLTSALYNFNIPKEMSEFLNVKSKNSKSKSEMRLNKLLTLKTGSLVGKNSYKDQHPTIGWINPMNFQGNNTLFQILMDVSNPILNEMYPEINWENDGLELALYNRVKPFSYKDFKPGAGSGTSFKSYFQNVKYHDIESVKVISVNAGTNWRDKFNYLEVRPGDTEFKGLGNWIPTVSQAWDKPAFEREGFRPLIQVTRQYPASKDGKSIDFNRMKEWLFVMREWYFNTHRMLNGTITLQGTTDYIAVGDNIRFDVDLINPNTNMDYKAAKSKKNKLVLAHVENIVHSFTVGSNGARTYRTVIQFVRGILVNNDNSLASTRGSLDKYVGIKGSLSIKDTKNVSNTVSTSDLIDPDPQKVKGR